MWRLDRRTFLQAAAAPAVAGHSSGTSPSPAEFKAQLEGPILSIPTVYTADFRVDHEAIRTMIARSLSAGVKVVSLTAGNGQYDRLTYDEIRELTRIMIEAVNGRALTIAATGPWWTGQAVDYARYAASIGADAVQVMLPGYGDTDSLFAHFRAVASATRKAIVLHGQAPFDLLARLVSIESLVAYKEEYPPLYTVQLFNDYGRRLNIFGGGGKSRAIQYRPYGMKAYYSAFTTFALPVAMHFWEALRTNDFTEAHRIESRYEIPYRKHASHAWWRATLEHFGVAKRYLRPPDRFFNDGEMGQVHEFYAGLGLT